MIRLNNDQIKQLSDFTSNLSLLFFGTAVTPLFASVDTIDLFVIILGLALAFVCLLGSLFLLKGRKYE